MSSESVSLDKIVALCKRRGFVYQSSDIYGGLNGVYDFGPLGTLLKQNIRNAWVQSLKETDKDIVFFEGAILGSYDVWKASGHAENFNDPMVDCLNCKKRYRADEINLEKPCPACGKKEFTRARQFNMMFKTNLGAAADEASIAYLRPETAQSIFTNFKNVISTTRVQIPFGIAQIGKAFRNEITPKQFLFRMREFEQMELEWFCKKENTDTYFKYWIKEREKFYDIIDIKKENLRLQPHDKNELSHYSSQTTDIEYHFPFGWKELEGIADRGNFDLTQHSNQSGKELTVYDEQTKQSYIPDVVECSVGVDRMFLMVLFDAYTQDTIDGQERIVLKISPKLAPIKAAFLPLTKKLSDEFLPFYKKIKKQTGFDMQFDVSGSIGKRYRRQDEIGTPVCFTYDFDSQKDGKVTARNRNTTKQERIAIDQLETYLQNVLQ